MDAFLLLTLAGGGQAAWYDAAGVPVARGDGHYAPPSYDAAGWTGRRTVGRPEDQVAAVTRIDSC